MSTTFALVRQEMLRKCPAVGRVLETPSSITTTTAVFSQLATGGVLAEKYKDQWLLRPDAASAADRIRRISNFATATGTLSHAGPSYSDTTAGSEVFEILAHEEYLYGNAINAALASVQKLDRTEILALAQGGRHYLAGLTWLKGGVNKVRQIVREYGPQLSRDRDLTKWNNYQPASGVGPGSLIPDDWVLTGTGCTMARGGTYTWRGAPASLSVTPAAGVAAVLTQSPGLAESGVTADTLRGYVVTATGRIRATDASNVRVWVSEDGSTTKNYSSYHTGGSQFSELSSQFTLTSSATDLTFGMEAAAAKLVCQVGELWLDYQPLTDSGRRFNQREEIVWDYRYPGQDGLPVMLPGTGIGGHYVIYSDRSYPQVIQSRIDAGTADDDVIDAPVELISVGALWKLFHALGETGHRKAAEWRALGEDWRIKFEAMAPRHLEALDSQHSPGLKLAPPRYGRPRRIPR